MNRFMNTRRVTTALSITALVAAGALTACSNDDDPPDDGAEAPAADPELIAYLDEKFGVRISGWTDEGELPELNEEGFIVTRASGVIRVAGYGERALAIEELIAPASDGGEIVLVITDVESGDQRTFLYNHDESYVVFGEDTGVDDSRGVGVQRNPDGTHEVWSFDDAVSDRTDTRTVGDGYAAMRAVEAFNHYSDVHPHILMMTIALGHTVSPEARSLDVPNADLAEGAGAPAACSIFKELCDCSACLVLDRGDDCDLCPQL